METRSSGKFWLTHYNINNQIETIYINWVWNICVLNNPKQNDVDKGSFISIWKIKGIKTRRDRNNDPKFFFAKHISTEANLPKKCFNSQDEWEKTSYLGIADEGYRQKHEMQVASKKACWKNKSVPNTCDISPLKKIFFQNLTCFFQISLKYIKLVIPEILFVLVLCNFDFYFKTRWPLQQN